MAATTGRQTTSGRGRAAPLNGGELSVASTDWSDARYQAHTLLRIAFTVAPIAFGLDKFFNVMVDWPIYLAPWINDIAPGSGQDFMYVVGAIEIFYDRLARFITPPATVLVNLFERAGGESCQHGDPPERVPGLRDVGLCHQLARDRSTQNRDTRPRQS